MGGPSAKVGLSAKLCVLVFKASLLNYRGVHLPKCVCLPSVVYWHSRHLCCIQGGPLAKVGSSAKCCVLVFKASMLYVWGVHQPKKVCLPSTSLTSRWGVHWPKKVCLPIMNTLLNLLLLHRGLFYERPITAVKTYTANMGYRWTSRKAEPSETSWSP